MPSRRSREAKAGGKALAFYSAAAISIGRAGATNRANSVARRASALPRFASFTGPKPRTMSGNSASATAVPSVSGRNTASAACRSASASCHRTSPPRWDGPGWAEFPPSQARAILALDFFTADLLTGTKVYVLAIIEHGSRRVRVLGAAEHPVQSWVVQQARNLLMDLGDTGTGAKFVQHSSRLP